MALTLLVAIALGATSLWRLDRPPVFPREGRSLESAVANLNIGRYLVAATRLRRTLSLNPNNTTARELFQILSTLGLPFRRLAAEDALDNAKKLHGEQATSAYLNMLLGELERKNGDPEKSVDYHLTANKINPGIPQNWYLLGISYRQLEQHEMARAAFAAAAKLKPRHVYTYELAQQNYYIKRYQEALDWYQTTLKVAAFRLDAAIGEIRTLYRLGRFDAALERLDSLLDRLRTNSRMVRKISKSTRLVTGSEHFRLVGGFDTAELIVYLSALRAILDPEATDFIKTGVIENADDRLTELLDFDVNRNEH